MAAPLLYTVGYEGRAQFDLLALLSDAGIERLVDVRIRAQSRKPGLSKTSLAAGLEASGMAYEHLRDLGTPLEIRADFRAGDLATGRARYREYLLADALPSLDYLAQVVRKQRTAILCFEFDERECHRLVVAEELERLHGITAEHLR